MVAASINRNDSSAGNLTIRETTLLPNIRGIGPLIALLFCPTMELKRDETSTRYISFISGLGYNKKEKRPIFEEHDSIFHLDVELTDEDFGMVSGSFCLFHKRAKLQRCLLTKTHFNIHICICLFCCVADQSIALLFRYVAVPNEWPS